jgi:hypothetical protein
LGAYGTYTKPEVAYDKHNDRFVVFYIDKQQSGLRSRHASAAAAPGWSTTSAIVAGGRYRYLGGAVFSNVSNQGLLVAAYWDYPSVPLYEIVQINVTYSGGNYVGGLAYYMNSSLIGSYRTRRPFGIAYRRDQNRVVVAWRGVLASESMMVASKIGLSATTSFSAPSLELSAIRNSVDVAFAPSTGAFVAGVTWP